jgi:hypothetical protein
MNKAASDSGRVRSEALRTEFDAVSWLTPRGNRFFVQRRCGHRCFDKSMFIHGYSLKG